MKKIGLILFTGFCLAFAPARLAAQSDDPSEVFLKAYMTSQQGEKLEHDNQLQAALTKFRFAGSLLEELRKTHANWQPAIVDYRSRKIGEKIVRVQGKLGTQKDLAAVTSPPPAASNPPCCRRNPGRPTRARQPRHRRWSRTLQPLPPRQLSQAPPWPVTPPSRKRPGNCRTKSISFRLSWRNPGTNTTQSFRKRKV